LAKQVVVHFLQLDVRWRPKFHQASKGFSCFTKRRSKASPKAAGSRDRGRSSNGSFSYSTHLGFPSDRGPSRMAALIEIT
jgi:hypothetical protein